MRRCAALDMEELSLVPPLRVNGRSLLYNLKDHPHAMPTEIPGPVFSLDVGTDPTRASFVSA